MDLSGAVLGLYKRASTDLPGDVERAIKSARDTETSETACKVLDDIMENIKIAREKTVPICQDTGVPNFFIDYPLDYSQKEITKALEDATKTATEKMFLRPNAVNPLSGKNSGNNLGKESPTLHFHESDKLRVGLLLKGGGSENVSAQYKLPDASLNAGRDMDGVKKCVITSVFKAQGKGCSPYFLGVCIGGSRDSGYLEAKKQLFKKIGERGDMGEVEEDLIEKINKLGVGPMGFGGNTSVLDIKLSSLHRHPACFFVSVSVNCWALRRYHMDFENGEPRYY